MAQVYDNTVRDTLQQGERYRWTQSLQDLIDDDEFPNLGGLNAFALIVAPDRSTAFRFPAQTLNNNDTEVTFTMGGSFSENWEIGSQYLLQILFSDGTDDGKVISRTVNIKIKEGFARVPTTGLGTGSLSPQDFSSRDFNTGMEA